MTDWVGGLLPALGLLACPAVRVVGIAGRLVPWRRAFGCARRSADLIG
jgi:hypothetical protein